MTVHLLSERDLIKMNVLLIEKYSPKEPIGPRDIGVLNMMVSQLNQEIFGKELYLTLEDKAAMLVINIVKKHAFHNGNKRTAYMAMDVFLKLNGKRFRMENDDRKIDLVVDIATYQGDFELLKDRISEIIKTHTD